MKFFRAKTIPVCIGILFCLNAQAQEKPARPFIKVDGEVTKPITIYADDLAKMKRVTVGLKDRDGKTHNFTGITMQEILDSAGVTMGNQLRGENLSKYLLVKCADGYQVAFSLAEIDSSFTDRVSILADTMEGQPLPAGKGPFRLVIPGEKKPARSCFQVTEFEIKFSKD